MMQHLKRHRVTTTAFPVQHRAWSKWLFSSCFIWHYFRPEEQISIRVQDVLLAFQVTASVKSWSILVDTKILKKYDDEKAGLPLGFELGTLQLFSNTLPLEPTPLLSIMVRFSTVNVESFFSHSCYFHPWHQDRFDSDTWSELHQEYTRQSRVSIWPQNGALGSKL